MRWEGGRRSNRIEDRRGMRVGRGLAGGGLGGIVLLLIALYFGIDPGLLLMDSEPQPQIQALDPAQEELKEFVAVVLADTEDTWSAIFAERGERYLEPTLVLFTGQVQSGCGIAGAAAGPFYCPIDKKVYLDLRFFDELQQRFGAPGDFARAYVIAHEIGHHVQTLLGISEQTLALRQRLSPAEANALSVRQELQADCFAGIWAYHADRSRHLLEAGDIEEGLQAASAIGDDTLQQQAQGQVRPETFTHGSSAQRVSWFRQGLSSGDPSDCNTFATSQL